MPETLPVWKNVGKKGISVHTWTHSCFTLYIVSKRIQGRNAQHYISSRLFVIQKKNGMGRV